MKRIILSQLLLCLAGTILFAQKPQKQWELSKAESGTKAYVARDYISLKPGFSYKAVGTNTFTAKIDEYLLFPPNNATYGKPGGTPGSTTASGGVVGAIPGQFAVSPSGAATYTIPIEVPAGINGMQPNISLVYNSQGGNGIAGWGWNIGGVSMISRAPKNLYFDNVISGMDWTKESPLMLDGQRLIKISDTEYRTENESFSKITAESIQAWGPEVIKVQTKEGLIMEYGNSVQSASYLPLQYPSSGKRQGWLLTKVKDLDGDFIKYNYKMGLNPLSKTFVNHVLESISYGNNQSGTEVIVATVSFGYQSRRAALYGYIDGEMLEQHLLLENIEVKSNESIFRKYELKYKNGIDIDWLDEVKLYGANGNFYNSTKFNNNTEKSAINNFTEDKSGVKSMGPPFYLGTADFTGNGVDDIYYLSILEEAHYPTQNISEYVFGLEIHFRYRDNNNQPKLFDSGHKSYTLPLSNLQKIGSGSFKHTIESQFGDFFANGLTSFFRFAPTQKGFVISFFNLQGRRADVESKKIEIINKSSKSSSDAKPFVVSGNFDGHFGSEVLVIHDDAKPIVGGYQYSVSVLRELGTKEDQFVLKTKSRIKNIIANNFMGSGKTDLFVVLENSNTIIENIYKGGNQYFNNIIHGEKDAILDLRIDCLMEIGNLNFDNLPDFIYRVGADDWRIAYNRGDGNFNINYTSFKCSDHIDSKTTSNKDADIVRIVDINNDGFDDLIFGDEILKKDWDITGSWWKYDRTDWSIYIFKNNKFELYNEYSNKERASEGFGIGDILGDGKLKLMKSKRNEPIKYYSSGYLNDPYLIVSIVDGLGNQTNINYTNLWKVGYNSQDALNLPVNLYLHRDSYTKIVNSYYNSLSSYEVKFWNPIFHKAGKGFLGFLSVIEKEGHTGIETETTNKLNAAFNTLVPYLKETRHGINIISRTESNISLVPLGSKRFVSRLTSVKEENKLSGTTATISYSNYDSYGNPKTISTSRGDGISETQSLVYTTAGSWCDNMVKSISTTRTNAGVSETLSASYDYYNTGKLKTHTANPGKGKFQITNSYEYDAFGNLTKETVNNNGDSRSVSRTYTPSGRFLKTETNNQLKETVTYNFNEATGTLTSMVTPSGTTKYTYDGFGRITGVEYPDKNRTATARQWAGSAVFGAIYYVYEESSGTGPVKIWYDGQGRELRRDLYGLGGKVSYIKTEYNSMGQLYSVSEPFTGSVPNIWAVTYDYDNYGRKTTETNPLGATTYAYSGLKTTVTSPLGTVETTLNSAGQVLTSKENGKTVTFKYHPSGKLESATPEGGTAVSYKYDLLGYPTEVNDPNTGKVTYLYNGFGEIVEQSRPIHTGKADVKTTYSYHSTTKLPATVSVNGQTTSYAYDSRNRLKSETISGVHSRTYEYDSYNRPVKVTETITGKSFVSSTTYDAYGRVAKETFPSGFYISNEYDENGFLVSVTGSKGQKIWEAVEANIKGQLTRYKQGGYETIIDYHDIWGLPNSIVSGNRINMAYYYTDKGNLDYREDRSTSGSIRKEKFYYDWANRLENYDLSLNGTLKQSHTIQYDAVTGGIQNKTDVGFQMEYGQNAPFHALAVVQGLPKSAKAPQAITYSDINKVKSITQGSKVHQITYGVDQQRIKGIFKTGSTTTLTKYYLGNYEEEVDASGNIRKLHYIYGSNGLAAIMEYKNGQENLFYTFSDYQGNLLAVTNSSGIVQERYAYDPWGVRRNPTNWTQPDTRTSFLFSRGYTLHEHLDDFGLINMNGRMYDPLMAQFLSPDPYIQAPGSWMNYNRYAYCYNNPLIYTDPSGEFIGALLGIWAGNYLINSVAYAVNNKVSLGTAFRSTPIVGSVGFSPSGFITGQKNMGFSHYQLDAHLAVKNLIRVSNELDAFIAAQSGGGSDFQMGGNTLGNLSNTVSVAGNISLYFNGNRLHIVDESTGRGVYNTIAYSGRGDGMNNPASQNQKSIGPIPQGNYTFQMSNIQTISTLDNVAGSVGGLLGQKWGGWPGGTYSWGNTRVFLTPSEYTNTYDRGGFSIHGGYSPGSAGCIDLIGNNNAFFNVLQNAAGGQNIVILRVRY